MDVKGLPVMTCGEVQQKKCSIHNNCKHDKDQKMRPLRQGVRHEQRNAEVLLRGMSHGSKRKQEEKTEGFPSGS